MKLSQVVTEKTQSPKKGTYVGVRLSKESEDKVFDAIDKLDVPDPVKRSEMHMTVIYSRKHLPDFEPRGKLDEPIKIKAKKLDIFPSGDGGSNVLVVVMDAPDLVNRHEEVMDEHKATYDYPEYIPHMTLSYDCGDFDAKGHDMGAILGELDVVNEYEEELTDGKYK